MRKLLILLLLCSPLWAQTISINHLKTNTQTFPELVHTSVLALDNDNEPLKNLTGKNFQISFGGAKVDTLLNLTTLEASKQGLSIMICVDVSGSMKGKPLDSVKNALLSFIGDKRNNDEVAIYAFAEQPELVCDFTTDTEFLRKSIKNLKVLPGDTSLYYSIDKGLDRLSGNAVKNEGRFMILFSDGKEDNPAQAYTIENVIEKAQQKQIPIFTVGYTAQQKQYLQYLEKIAKSTGGSYYDAPDASSLDKHFGKVRRQILGSWILSYPVFGVKGDGLEKDLSVILIHDVHKAEFPDPIKVRVPSNKEAIDAPDKGNSGRSVGSGLSLGWILGIIAVLLAIGIGVFFWLNSKKKKRLEEQRLREQEEERQRQEQQTRYQAEQMQRQEEERKILEQTRRDEGARQPEQVPRSRDHTIILGQGAPSANRGQSLSMEVMMGAEQGRVFNIGSEGATLGRVQGNTVAFNDSTVSSHHARIYWSDGQFYIEDLGSLNGTFVNGQKVTLSRIESGSTFKLGSNEGVFRLS